MYSLLHGLPVQFYTENIALENDTLAIMSRLYDQLICHDSWYVKILK